MASWSGSTTTPPANRSTTRCSRTGSRSTSAPPAPRARATTSPRSPATVARAGAYATTLVRNGGARVKLVLKPGTTIDTTGVDVDQGYTAEMVVDLTKI